MNESFWTLLRSAAHWEFEFFLMIVFDGLILGALWPFLRKHYLHHIARDQQDQSIMSTPYFRPDPYSKYVSDWHMEIKPLFRALVEKYRPFDDVIAEQKTPKTVDDDITKA